MRRAIALLGALLALAILPSAAWAAYPAQGNFGIDGFGVTFGADGQETLTTQAGSHPYAMTTRLATNVDGEEVPEGWLRDILFELVPGLVGDTTAYPRCTTLEFIEILDGVNNCRPETQVGITANATSEPGLWSTAPVFNLTPPPGVLLRLGFHAVVPDIVVDVGLSPERPHNPTAASRNTPQLVSVFGNITQLWGDPASEDHDALRGQCGRYVTELPLDEIASFRFQAPGEGTCPLESRIAKPFLTLPTDCSAPPFFSFEAFSWEGPSALDDGFDAGGAVLRDAAGNPRSLTGCGALASFEAELGAQPTSLAAQSPTGLDLSLQVDDEGLISGEPGARSQSHIRRVAVTLPEGMTANPSLAEGLEVCSEGDLARETLAADPGEGCPQAAKIGTIEVESPLVSETIKGALFQATPRANLAGDSLLAFYIVLKNPRLGIIVKQPARVQADPETGQLTGITEEIPQLPFSSFRLRFREGGRSPLVSPPRCGSHHVEARLTPWSGQASIEVGSRFEIISGPAQGPCPPGGVPPFEPGFAAGSLNNAAASFSPFAMRLTRRDGDQDMVRFDAVLPPGVTARLAGVTRCPEAQIALARAKTGRAELSSPSCPLGSHIGTVRTGAGVGSQLTYVQGTVYLAGPFAGEPLSAVAVVPAVAGPFDIGTVVYRQALRVDPHSAVVTADGALSDPLPTILEGIPLVVRDVQVSVDRAGFTLNPTSCEPFATTGWIWGAGADPLRPGDEFPVARQTRYQAAGCARLGFAPRLALRLKGGTRRGGFPALRAVYRPRPGHANLKRLSLRFPRSAFIEQGHFRTICTRVQFAAGACPKGSIYGRARAFTPLLDQPLEGPVYLRSSSNNLPDAVFALKGLVSVEVVVRIDSVRGGLRATVASAPDVPVSRVIVNMRGGQKGLIVNSRDLCRSKNRATARTIAHSAKRRTLRPLVRPGCRKQRRARSSHRHR